MHRWFSRHRPGKAFLGLMALSLVLATSEYRIMAADAEVQETESSIPIQESSDNEPEEAGTENETETEIEIAAEEEKNTTAESEEFSPAQETGEETSVIMTEETGTTEVNNEEIPAETETDTAENGGETASAETEPCDGTETSESSMTESETGIETETSTEMEEETETSTESETEAEEETETSTETETEAETETETETEEDKERAAQVVSVLLPADFTLLMYENPPGSGYTVLESTDLLVVNTGDEAAEVVIEDVIFEVNQEKAGGQDKKLVLEIMEYGKEKSAIEVSSEHGFSPVTLKLEGRQDGFSVGGLRDGLSDFRVYGKADAPNYCVMKLKGGLGSGTWNENDVKVRIVYKINQPEY